VRRAQPGGPGQAGHEALCHDRRVRLPGNPRRAGRTQRLRARPYPTGLHQLDGARYLRDARHADALLCRLVAHHSCAIVEAGERGLADVLSLEFEPAPYALSSVLTFCDMTTSPDGEPVPAGQRLAEIHDRYDPGHRSMQRATPMILPAVEQVHNRAALPASAG
jgi:hypothetical protein